MTKCEKSQECVEKNIKELENLYETYKKATDYIYFKNLAPSFSLRIRKILMTLRSCILRYSIHIEALNSTCPVLEMPRVTYDEEKFDSIIEPSETDEVRRR